MTKRSILLASIAHIVPVAAFQSAGWKLDADGKIEMKDGNPVWIDANGGEKALGGDTITRLNGEAKTMRERAEAAEAAYEPFKGLDAKVARSAVETVGKLDAKQLIDAGEVDKVRDDIKRQYEEQLGEKDKAIGSLNDRVIGMTKDTAFATSKYIAENVDTPLELFKPAFADRFKYEGDKLIPYDQHGNKIMSKDRFGEVANFDEAIGQLIEQSPFKDKILKAPSHSGSGSDGGGGSRGNSRVLKRADYDRLDAGKQMEAAAAAGKGELSIVD